MDADAFRELLEQNYTWPSVYMFKFICPSDNQTVAQVEALFNTETAEVTLNRSKKGNFVSVTAKELMTSADAVVERYEKARNIPGLISL